MDEREFNRELRKWLAKPPGESVGDVIERLMAAPEEKQTEVAKIVTKLLGDSGGWSGPPREPTPADELSDAVAVAWLAFLELRLAGLRMRQLQEAALVGYLWDKVTPETARRACEAATALYVSLERLYGPLIDKLAKFEAMRASTRIALVEACEVCEDRVFALELKAAALRAAS